MKGFYCLLLTACCSLLLMGCSGVKYYPPPVAGLGDATYTMVEYRAGTPMGPNIVVLDVYETKAGQTKLLHTNAASTGGALDALIGTGKILDSASGMADKAGAAVGAAK